jgi:hypothetical protein
MIKYPSIEQFRNVIRTVKIQHDYKGKDEQGESIYKHDSPYPTLKFKGTVKLHGTNAAIVKYKDGTIKFQSRENELSLIQDNAGFALYMSNVKNLDQLFEGTEFFEEYVAVYGEWCGGNIQKGVVINGLPKMFVIFGLKIDGVWYEVDGCDPYLIQIYWVEGWNKQNIYHINQFQTYSMDIDFNNPELAQNKLIEITEKVEQECPVGKYFGQKGIGEGVVWSHLKNNGELLIFKVKGEKHSVSKVTKLASIDTELLKNMQEFVDLAIQEPRLLQSIEKLKELGKELTEKSTGDFLRWIINDVIKEEEDTIIKNQFDIKKLNPIISKKAREWYFNYLNKETYV